MRAMRDFNFHTANVLDYPCYIIAEIGVNHGGDVHLGKEMIRAAKQSGADAVKFQTFTAETLVTTGTPKVKYQENTTHRDESHYEMIRKLELRREDHKTLKEFCDSQGIDFISTPYDIQSAVFLDTLGVSMFKTASADLVDLPLQEFLAKTGKPVIIATGMSSLGEVEVTVNIYRQHHPPKDLRIALLHCVSSYPSSNKSLNLRAMQTLQAAFGTVVGFSDHSMGFLAATTAVALGAKIIEKHFTLDKAMPGPDHRASSTPEEFSELVEAIRHTEEVLGANIKKCQEEERQMAQVSRKSIVAAKNISAGERIQLEHLCMKRPGTGLPASAIPEVVNKIARRDLCKDEVLSWSDVNE